MGTITKVDSTSVDEGFRVVKTEQYGMKTADLVQGFGEDSNPIKGMMAIFQETDTDGNPIIIGYINPNAIAAEGERRMYSVDASGNEQAFIWLKNDGDIELNGNSDNVVRFSELEKMMDKLKSDLNVELTKIASGISSAGGSYIKKDIQIDSDKCKVENVKCP